MGFETMELEAQKPPYKGETLSEIRHSVKDSLETAMLIPGPGRSAEKAIERYGAKKTKPKETLAVVAEGLYGLSNLEDNGLLDPERVPEDASDIRELIEDCTRRIEGIREGRDRIIAENPEAYRELMESVIANLENDILSNDPEGRFKLLRELGTAEYITKAVGVLEGIEKKYKESLTLNIEVRRSSLTGGVSASTNTEQEYATKARQHIAVLDRVLAKSNHEELAAA